MKKVILILMGILFLGMCVNAQSKKSGVCHSGNG